MYVLLWLCVWFGLVINVTNKYATRGFRGFFYIWEINQTAVSEYPLFEASELWGIIFLIYFVAFIKFKKPSQTKALSGVDGGTRPLRCDPNPPQHLKNKGF